MVIILVEIAVVGRREEKRATSRVVGEENVLIVVIAFVAFVSLLLLLLLLPLALPPPRPPPPSPHLPGPREEKGRVLLQGHSCASSSGGSRLGLGQTVHQDGVVRRERGSGVPGPRLELSGGLCPRQRPRGGGPGGVLLFAGAFCVCRGCRCRRCEGC